MYSMTQRAQLDIGTPFSMEAWAVLGEDTPGELVCGHLVEEEMASHIHELVVGFLLTVLRAWLVPKGGFVGGSGAKFEVAEDKGRKPDLYAYFAGSKLPPASAAISTVPPDIMVEVVSATPSDVRRDRIDKLREYAAFGAKYYWIVDPTLRSAEVLQLDTEGRYVHVAEGTDGILNAIPGCEGLVVDLDAMWEEVDRFIALSDAETPA